MKFWFMLMILRYWAELYILKENTEDILDVSKHIGLEINADKPKDMVMSRDQTAGRSQLKKD
jgi:hypothetical protein